MASDWLTALLAANQKLHLKIVVSYPCFYPRIALVAPTPDGWSFLSSQPTVCPVVQVGQVVRVVWVVQVAQVAATVVTERVAVVAVAAAVVVAVEAAVAEVVAVVPVGKALELHRWGTVSGLQRGCQQTLALTRPHPHYPPVDLQWALNAVTYWLRATAIPRVS